MEKFSEPDGVGTEMKGLDLHPQAWVVIGPRRARPRTGSFATWPSASRVVASRPPRSWGGAAQARFQRVGGGRVRGVGEAPTGRGGAGVVVRSGVSPVRKEYLVGCRKD